MSAILDTLQPALRRAGDLGVVLVLENIDRAVIALDQSGHVTLFNPAAESFMERSARSSLGQDYRRLFAGQETFLYLTREALEGGRSITDDEGIFLLRPNSPPLPVNVYVAPTFSKQGNQEGAVLIIRDLSMVTSSWRSERTFSDFLRQSDTVAIADIDTRKLTRVIREKGAQSGCIMTGDADADKAIAHARKFPGIAGMDLAPTMAATLGFEMPDVDGAPVAALPKNVHKERVTA